jgi:hypothetical protein
MEQAVDGADELGRAALEQLPRPPIHGPRRCVERHVRQNAVSKIAWTRAACRLVTSSSRRRATYWRQATQAMLDEQDQVEEAELHEHAAGGASNERAVGRQAPIDIGRNRVVAPGTPLRSVASMFDSDAGRAIAAGRTRP